MTDTPRYFSRLRLRRDDAVQAARAALLAGGADRDRGHGLIWLAFANQREQTRDFLFREIPDGFYCVSPAPPGDGDGVWEVATKVYDPLPAPGLRVRFSLRAAPMVALKRPGQKHSARVNMVARAREDLRRRDPSAPFGPPQVREAALPWLLTRAAGLGLEVDAAGVRVDNYRHDPLARKGGDAIRFASVDYEGTAEVTDPTALRQALLNGVGRGKAFGCGLLLLRPLESAS